MARSRRGVSGELILGIETSCDETAAAVVDQRRADPLERRRLPGRAACALRRRGARGRVAAPPGADHPGGRGRARRRRGDPRRCLGHRGDRRAGPDRRAARRPRDRQGHRVCPRPPADPGRPPARPRRLALPPADPLEPAVSVPAGLGRPHDPRRGGRSRELRPDRLARSTTPRGRRSTRAPGCWGSDTRAAPSSRRSPRAATPRPTRSRRRCSAIRATTSRSAA